LSADEIVGHMNILFISSTEPLAVALTWTLLILSQLPRLRRTLRDELGAVVGSAIPAGDDVERLVLLERVVNESLRVFPPNAFMVRLTAEPVLLGGFALPARCEVILCPYLSHRDAGAFERPDAFRPDRWKQPPPSPFQFFPFGAGGHACIGKALAMRMMKTALAFLLPRYDVVLAGDQEIDWRLHIQFMPKSDPAVVLSRAGSEPAPVPGKLGGPVRDMIRLDDEQQS
jgi:cytochrome P450